jgi:hypothetical protein
MTDTEGTLRLQPSGRWAVCRPGREPVEIPAGEVFLLEVPGHRQLQQTRMEFRRFEARTHFSTVGTFRSSMLGRAYLNV